MSDYGKKAPPAQYRATAGAHLLAAAGDPIGVPLRLKGTQDHGSRCPSARSRAVTAEKQRRDQHHRVKGSLQSDPARRRSQAVARGSGPSGRRRPWRLHLGRSRPHSRGGLAADRRGLRHLSGGHERRSSGDRFRQGRRAGRARRAGEFLAWRLGRREIQPPAAGAARHSAGALDHGQFPRLSLGGPDVAGDFALFAEHAGQELPARYSRTIHRLRRSRGVADPCVCHRDQCPHRSWPGVPQRQPHPRGAAGLGLSAEHVPGSRDRRRFLLGRRLFRQSDAHPTGPPLQGGRHDPHSHQSAGARRSAAHCFRHHQPPQRDFLQRRGAQGIAHDRHAAQGRGLRGQRRRQMGQPAPASRE